jgi:hypothetical protein
VAIKLGNKRYVCLICNKEFTEEIACDMHKIKDHDLVYVPLLASDLDRLRQFLFMRNEELLTPSLVRTITHYAEQAARRQFEDSD